MNKAGFCRSYLILLLILLIMVMLSACGSKSDELGKQETDADIAAFFTINGDKSNENIAGLFYKSDTLIDYMETDQNGSLYLLRLDESGNTLFEAIRDDKIDNNTVNSYFQCLCLDKKTDLLYTYNTSAGTIEVRNTKFEYIKTLLDDFHPFEVKEMIIKGDYLYALTVSQNPFEMDDDTYTEESDGYVDYGEELLKISLTGGEYKSTDIKNIITMCDSADRYIYLYTHRNDTYNVEVYDTESEKAVCSVSTEDIGYVFSMAVSGEDIFYVSFNSAGLCRYNIQSGTKRSLIPEFIVTNQSDFDISGRYLTVLNRFDWTVSTVDSISGKISNGKSISVNEEPFKEVLIGAVDMYSIPLPLKDISEKSGIEINTFVSPEAGNFDFNEELMMKLLSRDPEIDIFVLSTTEPYSRKISNDGVCYPLNSSKIITDDNNAFFENISSKFKTPGGNIWGIPLNSYMEVMAASPKNMADNGISTDIFRDYKTFMNTMKKLDKRDGIFVLGYDYGFALMSDYITNNHTDFCNSVLKDYCVSMWNGWKLYDDYGYANNPYLGEAEDRSIALYGNKALLDPDTTQFHMVAANEVLFNDSWSDDFDIYGVPLLYDTDKQCISLYKVAVINPYSKNIDNAIKVLEAMSEYLHDNGSLGTVYKDRSDYSSVIDTGSKRFTSLYALTGDALVTVHGITNDVMMNEVSAYQSGNIDLDTAISSIQRKEDIYLNE